MTHEIMGLGASADPYASNLHLAPPTPHHSIFTGWMLLLTPNQQCQSTEGSKAEE